MNRPDILRAALSRTPECPPLEMLQEPLSGSIQLHLNTCAHCQTERKLLQEFELGAIRPDERDAVTWISRKLEARTAPSAEKRLGWFTPRLMAGFAAFAGIALLAIGLSTRPQLQQAVPQFGSQTMRSQSIEVLAAPGAFSWEPVPGAKSYSLSVTDVAGQTIFHNIITKTTLAYPAEVATLVATGKLVVWEVTARDASGNVLAQSGAQRLRKPR